MFLSRPSFFIENGYIVCQQLSLVEHDRHKIRFDVWNTHSLALLDACCCRYNLVVVVGCVLCEVERFQKCDRRRMDDWLP